VALLAGACTIPEARKQGAQLALLDYRLRYAAEQGCDLAMMCAQPGSASQRNAERHGFRIAYTRIKWQLAEKERGLSSPRSAEGLESPRSRNCFGTFRMECRELLFERDNEWRMLEVVLKESQKNLTRTM
jgi:hypothetical protein